MARADWHAVDALTRKKQEGEKKIWKEDGWAVSGRLRREKVIGK